MRAIVVIGGYVAVGLLVAEPRNVLGFGLMVASFWIMATYSAPAEDGGNHREGMETSDA